VPLLHLPFAGGLQFMLFFAGSATQFPPMHFSQAAQVFPAHGSGGVWQWSPMYPSRHVQLPLLQLPWSPQLTPMQGSGVWQVPPMQTLFGGQPQVS
jgi:hypothetical protein